MLTDTVSIGGTPETLQIQPKHFGTLLGNEDYSSTSHFFYVNGSLAATDRLTLFATTSFTFAQAELERVQMPSTTAEVNSVLPHQDFTFLEMNTYSDLTYQILRFSGGFELALARNVRWSVSGEFADLTADEEYVYGDESGSLFLIRSGIAIDF